LISGVATAIKSLNPNIKVIGVEPEFAADARDSLRAGKIVEITAADAWRTVADGVRTLFVGDITFAHMQQYVDDIITVSESEIKEALRRVVFDGKLVVEPSGVLPVAAYLFHQKELPPSNNTVMVLSGGSVEPAQLAELLKDG
jgi:threo-3-hydroxy-L-aspartate ammonia-lyase